MAGLEEGSTKARVVYTKAGVRECCKGREGGFDEGQGLDEGGGWGGGGSTAFV